MISSVGDDCNMEVVASSNNTQPWNPNYGCDIIQMPSWPTLKAVFDERALRFWKHQELQYFALVNVSTVDFKHIDYLRSRGHLPRMKIMYDEDKSLMIVKLVPVGLPHALASMFFHNCFRKMVPLSAGIVEVGSTRFGVATGRHKEPDQSYLPKSTRFPNPTWPSVVLEVGVAQSLHQLREDARYWLISSKGQVLVVILISMDLVTRDAIWERWEHVPPDELGTQSRSHIQPTLMQVVELPSSGLVSGVSFRIPSNKIWDVVPDHVGAEIVFTTEDLAAFSSKLIEF